MTHKYQNGQYFVDTQDPRIEGVIIIEQGNIGYDGYRVAEKDVQTGLWRRYWMKDRHLHEDVNHDVLDPGEVRSADDVRAVERKCKQADMEIQRASNGISSVTPADD